MTIKSAFFFWLGRLDTCVAAGDYEHAGGTRDIRFCDAKDEVDALLDGIASMRDYQWRFSVEPYPEAGIPRWSIDISKAHRQRTECTMPRQSPSSEGSYPLWQKVVRVLPQGADPLQAIVFLRDVADGINARVLHWGMLAQIPEPLRGGLLTRDECGRFLDFSGSPLELEDSPLVAGDVSLSALAVQPSIEDMTQDQWIAYVQQLRGPTGREPVTTRRKRSRSLAQAMKQRYEYRCQLCRTDDLVIDMGSGKYYVEIHHVRGLAETEKPRPNSPQMEDRQEANDYCLDSYENIVVLCPYHHRLLHYYRGGFEFDRARKKFIAKDGSQELDLVRDLHL